MLESKQHAAFWCHFDLLGPNGIDDFGKNSLRYLVNLVTPEDTSEQEGGRENVVSYSEASKTKGNVKVVFWLVMGIAISLAIGKFL